MQTEPGKRRFTVDEFYKMGAIGILDDGNRTELVDGEVVEMSPMGPRHAAAVNRVSSRLGHLLDGKALVRVRMPVRLNAYNEPQPDIAFVKARRDFYDLRHPGPADVLAVLEISDTTLDYDRDVKLGVYAAVRIPECWVLDIAGSALLVFRGPSRGDYKTFLRFGPGECVAMLAFPDIEIAVSDLL
jgi:Uma2 family endonuclease